MQGMRKQAVIGSLLNKTYEDSALTAAQLKSVRRHAAKAALRGEPVSPDFQRYIGYDKVHRELFGKGGPLSDGYSIAYNPTRAYAAGDVFNVPGIGPTAFHEFGHGLDHQVHDQSFFGDRSFIGVGNKASTNLRSEASASRRAIEMLRKAHGVDEITDPVAKKRALNEVYAGAADLASAFDTYVDGSRFNPEGGIFANPPEHERPSLRLLSSISEKLETTDDAIKSHSRPTDPRLSTKLLWDAHSRRRDALMSSYREWDAARMRKLLSEDPNVRINLKQLQRMASPSEFLDPFETDLMRRRWHFRDTYLPGGDVAAARIVDDTHRANRAKLIRTIANLDPEQAELLRQEMRKYIQQSGEYLGRDAKRGVIRDLIKMRNEVRPLIPKPGPSMLERLRGVLSGGAEKATTTFNSSTKSIRQMLAEAAMKLKR